MSIGILAVDDHEILRAGIRLVTDDRDDLQIIGEACDGSEAVQQAVRLKPDIVIMDISMAGLNGIDATRQIKAADSNIKVLALTGFSHHQFVIDMLKAGADGYILKDCLSDELIKGIYAVCAGKKYLCNRAEDIVIESVTHDKQAEQTGHSIEKLTDKESELLKLVAEGFSGKEIAYKLGISIKTVDGRKRKVMKKLVLHGIADLTRFAISQGLVSADFEHNDA